MLEMTETKMIKEISLSLPKGQRILSGKEVGIKIRNEHELDKLDDESGFIQVKIDVPVLTSSFILGMFSRSVMKLGVDKFFEKYHFEGRDDIIKNIEVNARYSATEGTALN